ncbi:unnamed protein product [Rhizophagus irregularis]|nr:unnamed protein product [Rhizophagus irregularis]
MSSYSSLSRVLSPFRVQTKTEENTLPARYMAYYLVLGEVPAKRKLDYVEFDSSKRVMILRNTIYDEKKNTFSSIDRNDLILWKVDIPFDCENDKLKMLDNVNLPPSSIHILVQPPPPATNGKGKRSLGDSDEDQNSKRVKLADPNIISTARKIMEDIMKLDEDESNQMNALDELDNTGTGELKIKLFGGFDEEEMKEWWNTSQILYQKAIDGNFMSA